MGKEKKYEGTLHERRLQATNAWIKKNLKQLNLKIDPMLYEKLQEEAKQQNRSMRSLCILKLSSGL